MSEQNQFLLYTAPDGAVRIEVFVKDETVWLTQKALAELFGVQVPGINKHLKTSSSPGSWWRLQLFPFWKQLPPTGKATRPATTASMPLSPSATG